MADGLINFGLIKPELSNALAAGYQSAETERLQQQTAQLKLDELKRDRDMMVKLQSDLVAAGKDPDLNKVFDALISTGNPDYVLKGLDGKRRLQAQQEFARIQGSPMPGATPAATPSMTATAPASEVSPRTAAMFGPSTQTPATNALTQFAPMAGAPQINALITPTAPAAPAAKPSEFTTAQVQDTQKRIDAMLRFASANAGTPEGTQAIQQARILQDQLELYAKKPAALPGLVQEYQFAKGEGFKGDFFDFRKTLAEAGRPPAQPRPEQPPVAVVDPTTGKQIYVTREEALRGRMTPAAAQEGITPKEIQKREANLPQATMAVKSFESNSDNFIKDLTALRDHPGLDSITGIVYGRTPSVTKEGRAAQALYDKVVAKGGFQMLQDMRNASKTGGALGNVSDREGAQLKSAFAAIDRTQNPEDVRNALTDVIDTIKTSKARMREAYDTTYEYKQGKTAPAAATQTGPDIDALLNKYK